MKKIDGPAVIALARELMLDLNEEEAKSVVEEFITLEEHLEALSRLDTRGVEPMVRPFDHLVMELREDEAQKAMSVEEVLENSRHTKDGMILLPRVVK